MTIRPMTADDIESIVTVEQECFRMPWTRGNFTEELANPRARLLLCEDGGEIVGYIGAWLIIDEYEIGNIAVRAQHRRKGYAERLLRAMLEAAARDGAVRITLEVRVGNVPALSLYRKLGFREVGLRKGYYADGEDALIMAKPLV